MPSPVLRSKFPPFLFSTIHRLFDSGNPEFSAAGWSLRRWCLIALVVLGLPFVFATSATAQSSPILTWNTNPESDIAGYIVHLGTASGNYSVVQDVGMVTSYTFSGLSSATVYYCAVQAYNTAGMTSGISSELSFTPQSTTVVPWSSSPILSWSSNPESDIAGYIVHLGTVRGNYPVVQDVGKVMSYAFTGLSSSTVYYCAVQAYNVSGLLSGISSEISFSPQSAAAVFNTWASSSGLSGAAGAPSAMPFQDGVKNVLKYAFNMNAGAADTRVLKAGDGTVGLPVFSVDQSKSPPSFTVEFLKRKGSGLVYTPKSSTDLKTFQSMNETPTVTSIDATWERVKIERPINSVTTPKLFGIVEVTLP